MKGIEYDGVVDCLDDFFGVVYDDGDSEDMSAGEAQACARRYVARERSGFPRSPRENRHVGISGAFWSVVWGVVGRE